MKISGYCWQKCCLLCIPTIIIKLLLWNCTGTRFWWYSEPPNQQSQFVSFFQRTWSLLVQVSQKQALWLWRTSPRTATTTCFPVSHFNQSTSAASNHNTLYSLNYITTIIPIAIITLLFRHDIKVVLQFSNTVQRHMTAVINLSSLNFAEKQAFVLL